MAKNKDEKSTSQASEASKPTRPIILLNRTRGRIMVPKPRVGKSGNPQKFACEIVCIHSGINKPLDLESWRLLKGGREGRKLEGDEPELRRLESVEEIPEMALDEVLQNCGDPPSVKWWLSVETRPRVRVKIEAWLVKLQGRIDRRNAKRKGK